MGPSKVTVAFHPALSSTEGDDTYTLAVWSGILYKNRLVNPFLSSRHRGSRQRLTVWKSDIKLKKPAVPEGLRFSRDTTFPALQIQHTLRGSMRLRIESERVVTSPLLSVQMQDRNQYIGRANWRLDHSQEPNASITYLSSVRRLRHRDILIVGVAQKVVTRRLYQKINKSQVKSGQVGLAVEEINGG